MERYWAHQKVEILGAYNYDSLLGDLLQVLYGRQVLRWSFDLLSKASQIGYGDLGRSNRGC